MGLMYPGSQQHNTDHSMVAWVVALVFLTAKKKVNLFSSEHEIEQWHFNLRKVNVKEHLQRLTFIWNILSSF